MKYLWLTNLENALFVEINVKTLEIQQFTIYF